MLLLAATVLLASPLPAQRAACERAYDRVESLARREVLETYAREILTEGKRAFVRDCEKTLPRRVVRCVERARSSRELYECT